MQTEDVKYGKYLIRNTPKERTNEVKARMGSIIALMESKEWTTYQYNEYEKRPSPN